MNASSMFRSNYPFRQAFFVKTSQTFVIPFACFAEIWLYGGGGSSSTTNYQNAGNAGSGGYLKRKFVGGESLVFTLGAGGGAGAAAAGGNSTLTGAGINAVAYGGKAGVTGSSSGVANPANTACTGFDEAYPGGLGGQNYYVSGSPGGGAIGLTTAGGLRGGYAAGSATYNASGAGVASQGQDVSAANATLPGLTFVSPIFDPTGLNLFGQPGGVAANNWPGQGGCYGIIAPGIGGGGAKGLNPAYGGGGCGRTADSTGGQGFGIVCLYWSNM